VRHPTHRRMMCLCTPCHGAGSNWNVYRMNKSPVPLCRWGKPVIVYGEPGIRKDHPVVKFLSHEGKCKSLSIYRPGCAVISASRVMSA